MWRLKIVFLSLQLLSGLAWADPCKLVSTLPLTNQTADRIAKKGYVVETFTLPNEGDHYSAYASAIKDGEFGFIVKEGQESYLLWRSPTSHRIDPIPSQILGVGNSKSLTTLDAILPRCGSIPQKKLEAASRLGHIRTLMLQAKDVLILTAQYPEPFDTWAPIRKDQTVGEFIIEMELYLSQIGRPDLDAEISRMKAAYRELLEKLRPLRQDGKSLAAYQALQAKLVSENFRYYLLDNDLMSDFFNAKFPAGACTAQSVLWTALMADLRLQNSEGQFFGLQDVSEHRRPVLWTKKTDRSYDLAYNTSQLPNNGPIYRGEYQLWLLIQSALKIVPNEVGYFGESRYAYFHLKLKNPDYNVDWLWARAGEIAKAPFKFADSTIDYLFRPPKRPRLYDGHPLSGGTFAPPQFQLPGAKSERIDITSLQGDRARGSGSWVFNFSWPTFFESDKDAGFFESLKRITSGQDDPLYQRISAEFNNRIGQRNRVLRHLEVSLPDAPQYSHVLAPRLIEVNYRPDPLGFEIATDDQMTAADGTERQDSPAGCTHIGDKIRSCYWTIKLSGNEAQIYRQLSNQDRLAMVLELIKNGARQTSSWATLNKFLRDPVQFIDASRADLDRYSFELKHVFKLFKWMDEVVQTNRPFTLLKTEFAALASLVRRVPDLVIRNSNDILEKLQKLPDEKIMPFFNYLDDLVAISNSAKSKMYLPWYIEVLTDPRFEYVTEEEQRESFAPILYQRAMKLAQLEQRKRGENMEAEENGRKLVGEDGQDSKTQALIQGTDAKNREGVKRGLPQGPKADSIEVQIMDEKQFQLILNDKRKRSAKATDYLSRHKKIINPKIFVGLFSLVSSDVLDNPAIALITRAGFNRTVRDEISSLRLSNTGNNEESTLHFLRSMMDYRMPLNCFDRETKALSAEVCMSELARSGWQMEKSDIPRWIRDEPVLLAAFLKITAEIQDQGRLTEEPRDKRLPLPPTLPTNLRLETDFPVNLPGGTYATVTGQYKSSDDVQYLWGIQTPDGATTFRDYISVPSGHP